MAIGAGVYSLYYSYLLNTPLNLQRVILIFFATIASYSSVQLIPLRNKEVQHPRQDWFLERSRLIYSLIMFSLLNVGILSFTLNWKDFLIFGHLFIIVILYERIGIFKELRSIPYLKSILISYVWATTCCVPQLVQYSEIYHGELQYLIMFCLNVWFESFCYILALTIPFDIRDYDHDKQLNLKTIVHLLGFKNAKILCLILMSYCLFIAGQNTGNYPIAIGLLLYYCALLIKSKSFLHDYYFFYGMDSLIILKILLIAAHFNSY